MPTANPGIPAWQTATNFTRAREFGTLSARIHAAV